MLINLQLDYPQPVGDTATMMGGITPYNISIRYERDWIFHEGWEARPSQFGGKTHICAVRRNVTSPDIISVSSRCSDNDNFSRKSGIFAAMDRLRRIHHPAAEGHDVIMTSWKQIRKGDELLGYHITFSSEQIMNEKNLGDEDRVIYSAIKIVGDDIIETLGKYWWLQNQRDHLPTVGEILEETERRKQIFTTVKKANEAETVEN